METKQRKKRSFLGETWHRLRKDKMALIGLAILVLFVFIAVFANFIAPYGYDDQDPYNSLQSPSAEHWFGTDNLGRDIFSRVVYGARISLSAGIFTAFIHAIGGTIIGITSGYYGGWTDNIIMRAVDVIMSVPSVLLSIAIAASLGPGMTNAIIAMAITGIPIFSRIIRATALAESGREYIRAAKACNASNLHIMAKHIFPNILPTFIVQFTMSVATCILVIASLSFIGLGAQPPLPEWGAMLSDGRGFIRDYPFVVLYPGLAIMLIIFALNTLGDGLRDALDPRLRGGK